MAKKKEERACWFRLFRNLRPMVDAVPAASAGAALKAAYAYFDTGEVPEDLDVLAQALFQAIKPAIDQSNEEYARAVAQGRRGSAVRWARAQEPPNGIGGLSMGIGGLSTSIAPPTEKETEKEKEKDLYPETEPPAALLPELEFDRKRQKAIQMLRSYGSTGGI